MSWNLYTLFLVVLCFVSVSGQSLNTPSTEEHPGSQSHGLLQKLNHMWLWLYRLLEFIAIVVLSVIIGK
jgi:hypothetical protein